MVRHGPTGSLQCRRRQLRAADHPFRAAEQQAQRMTGQQLNRCCEDSTHQPASRTGGVRAAWMAELLSLSMQAGSALLKESAAENEAMPMVVNRH